MILWESVVFCALLYWLPQLFILSFPPCCRNADPTPLIVFILFALLLPHSNKPSIKKFQWHSVNLPPFCVLYLLSKPLSWFQIVRTVFYLSSFYLFLPFNNIFSHSSSQLRALSWPPKVQENYQHDLKSFFLCVCACAFDCVCACVCSPWLPLHTPGFMPLMLWSVITLSSALLSNHYTVLWLLESGEY